MLRNKNESLIISYITLRRLIGILGMLLPLICLLGGSFLSDLPIQQSISSYYHTNMRDFFVGLLIGVSMFLVTYRGYETIDSIVTTAGGIAGLGVAIFPCLHDNASTQAVGIFQALPSTSDTIHISCALVFFMLLAANAFFLFTLKSKDSPKTRNKNIRNRIYRSCGIAIFVSIAVLVIVRFVLSTEEANQTKVVLILEAIMLLAFGFSWLVKGKTLFTDEPGQSS